MMGRKLLIVPVVHTVADLGSLAPEVRAVYEKLAGPSAWEEHRQAVEGLWNAVEKLLDARGLDPQATVLYQDGLPLCGKERQIVEDVAARGSRNHLLLARLMAAGARLEGTEDPKLLTGEYQRIKALLEASKNSDSKGPMAPDTGTTEARDRFIARRIDETLGESQTGILFVGLLHRVEDFLPPTIEAELLLPRPLPGS